jgi:hypothetical protein
MYDKYISLSDRNFRVCGVTNSNLSNPMLSVTLRLHLERLRCVKLLSISIYKTFASERDLFESPSRYLKNERVLYELSYFLFIEMELKHETLRSSADRSGAKGPGDLCSAPTEVERRAETESPSRY